MGTENIWAFVALALASVIQSLAAALVKFSARYGMLGADGDFRGALLLGAAFVLFGFSFPLMATGMAKVNLSMAQPFSVAVSFLAMVPVALIFFREPLGTGKLLGMILIVIGVVAMFAWGEGGTRINSHPL